MSWCLKKVMISLKALCLLLTSLSLSRIMAPSPRIPHLGFRRRPRLLSVQAPSPYTSASMLFSPPCHHPLLSSHRHHLPIALVWGEDWQSLTLLIAASLHVRYYQNNEPFLPSVFLVSLQFSDQPLPHDDASHRSCSVCASWSRAHTLCHQCREQSLKL